MRSYSTRSERKSGRRFSRKALTASRCSAELARRRVGNQYGHPHQETLDRLAAAGVATYGTGVAQSEVVVTTACDDQFTVTPPQALNAAGTPPAAPAPSAPPAVSAPAPVAPPPPPASVGCSVSATVSNASPTKGSTVTVYGALNCGGALIVGVSMTATWHYKTTTSSCAGVSGPTGTASWSTGARR